MYFLRRLLAGFDRGKGKNMQIELSKLTFNNRNVRMEIVSDAGTYSMCATCSNAMCTYFLAEPMMIAMILIEQNGWNGARHISTVSTSARTPCGFSFEQNVFDLVCSRSANGLPFAQTRACSYHSFSAQRAVTHTHRIPHTQCVFDLILILFLLDRVATLCV